jgi:hypothetical protein
MSWITPWKNRSIGIQPLQPWNQQFLYHKFDFVDRVGGLVEIQKKQWRSGYGLKNRDGRLCDDLSLSFIPDLIPSDHGIFDRHPEEQRIPELTRD